jgi:hypothetical protein
MVEDFYPRRCWTCGGCLVVTPTKTVESNLDEKGARKRREIELVPERLARMTHRGSRRLVPAKGGFVIQILRPAPLRIDYPRQRQHGASEAACMVGAVSHARPGFIYGNRVPASAPLLRAFQSCAGRALCWV